MYCPNNLASFEDPSVFSNQAPLRFGSFHLDEEEAQREPHLTEPVLRFGSFSIDEVLPHSGNGLLFLSSTRPSSSQKGKTPLLSCAAKGTEAGTSVASSHPTSAPKRSRHAKKAVLRSTEEAASPLDATEALSAGTVLVHYRNLAGRTVSFSKEKDEITQASLRQSIRDREGIPEHLQRLSFKGKTLDETQLPQVLHTLSAKSPLSAEMHLSVTMGLRGGMFGDGNTRKVLECQLVWDLSRESILVGTCLPPAQCFKVQNGKLTSLVVEGKYAYWPREGTRMVAGEEQEVNVRFTPTSQDYNSAELTQIINVVVPPAAVERVPDHPVIEDEWTCEIVWDLTSKPVEAGACLPPAQCFRVTNGVRTSELVEGTFQYTPPMTWPCNQLPVKADFTPTNNFYPALSLSQKIDVPMPKAQPEIIWPAPTSIRFQSALTEVELCASCTNTFVKPEGFRYSPPLGTVLGVGVHTLTVTVTPLDCLHFSETAHSVSLEVLPAIPTVLWRPALIVAVGNALSVDDHFNATCDIPGEFTYDRAEGEVLDIGTHSLTMRYRPTDAVQYSECARTVTITVHDLPAVDMEYVRTFAATVPECSHKHLLQLKYVLNEAFNHLADRSRIDAVHAEMGALVASLKKDGRWNDSVEGLLKIFLNSLSDASPKTRKVVAGNLKVLFTLLCPFDILEFTELVRKARVSVEALQDQHIVLLFGKTGCGKSTTINYLAGAPMRQCGENVEVAEVIESLSSIKISHGGSSETRYINAVKIVDSIDQTLWLCDTAGFDDTEGPEVDISNTIGLTAAANACASVRPLVLINRYGGGKGEEFHAACRNIASMLATNLRANLEKFTFGITRVEKEAYVRDFFANTIATSPMGAEDEMCVRNMIINKKFKEGRVHAVLPCAGEERRQRFLDSILLESNVINRPRDVFKYYYTDRSMTSVDAQLSLMKELTLRALDSGAYQVAEFYLQQMGALKDVLLAADPSDKFRIGIIMDRCVEAMKVKFNGIFTQAASDLARCAEDGNKLTAADLDSYIEKLALFHRLHTETKLLQLSEKITQYSALEQEVVTLANRIFEGFQPTSDAAQFRLMKLKILTEKMDLLLTLHPLKLTSTYDKAVVLCHKVVQDGVEAAESAYSTACSRCTFHSGSDQVTVLAAALQESLVQLEEFLQAGWQKFCEEYVKVTRISTVLQAVMGAKAEPCKLFQNFSTRINHFLQQQLAFCTNGEMQQSAEEKYGVLSYLLCLVDSLNCSAINSVAELRDFRSEAKNFAVSGVTAYVMKRIEVAREALNRDGEPDYKRVSRIVTEIKKLRNLNRVGAQTADAYHTLHLSIITSINRLIADAVSTLNTMQPQAVAVRVTTDADHAAFLMHNPYTQFGNCLGRLKHAQDWIDEATRDSLLHRITQDVLTHVKNAAQVVDSCNLMKLKNFGNIKKVNLMLKDVEYLREAIDHYLEKYDTDVERLFSNTLRVVISAFQSMKANLEFEEKGGTHEAINQPALLDALEIALSYLHECTENFTELEREDQRALLRQHSSAEAEGRNLQTFEQSLKQAHQHVNTQIAKYKAFIRTTLDAANEHINPSTQESDCAIATEPPLPSEPGRLQRMRSLTLHQMAAFDRAVSDCKCVLTMLNKLEAKFPQFYEKLDGATLKADQHSYFGNLRMRMTLEMTQRCTDERPITQHLERALYLSRLDSLLFEANAHDTFNALYNTFVVRNADMIQQANVSLREDIQRHQFGEVTVARLRGFSSQDTRDKIISLLQATYDAFAESVETKLQEFKGSMDSKIVASLLVAFSKFDSLQGVCDSKMVNFDVSRGKVDFHQRLVDILNSQLDLFEKKLKKGDFCAARAIKENVAAALGSPAISGNALYQPVSDSIAECEHGFFDSLRAECEQFNTMTIDEIARNRPPARVHDLLGQALRDMRLDGGSSATVWEQMKHNLKAKFTVEMISPMTSNPFGDFEGRRGIIAHFINLCPEDLARVLTAIVVEADNALKAKVNRELAALAHCAESGDRAGLHARFVQYAQMREPSCDRTLWSALETAVAVVERRLSTELNQNFLQVCDSSSFSFLKFQPACHSLIEFYAEFGTLKPEPANSILAAVMHAVSQRLVRDCAILSAQGSSGADLVNAAQFLVGVADSYNADLYGATVYPQLTQIGLKGISITDKIVATFDAFVARYISESVGFNDHVKRDPYLAGRGFLELRGLEPTLSVVKTAQETASWGQLSLTNRSFLSTWTSIDSQFMILRSKMLAVANTIKAEKFLEYLFVDNAGTSTTMNRDSSTAIAEFYAALFASLTELVDMCTTLRLSDATVGDSTLTSVAAYLNDQCDDVRRKMSEAIAALHLATQADDFRVFNMCFDHLTGMRRHNFGKFSSEMLLFAGVEAELTKVKTDCMFLVTAAVDKISLIIQQISHESVVFNNDEYVRITYAIPLYRDVLRAHLFSANLIFLKDKIQPKLDQIFTDMRSSNDKGRKMAVYLGTYLRENSNDMDPHGVGSDAMETYAVFDNFMNSVFEEKTKAQDIDYVKEAIRGNKDFTINKTGLKADYEQFSRVFMATMNTHLIASDHHLDAIAREIKRMAVDFGPGLIQNFHSVIPDVLAKIFALWSLMSAGQVEVNNTATVTEFHKKPHPVQIVAIFQLLGMSEPLSLGQKWGLFPPNAMANHLVQVGTGEGKSVVLALTAILLALFGYDVECASYSALLSDRDYAAFLPLFRKLGVDSYISYGTFYNLCNKVLNDLGDVRTLVKNVILPICVSTAGRASTRTRVLLIDEVDVFFKEDFYGATYTPTAEISAEEVPQIEPLVDWIWEHRTDRNLTLAAVKAATGKDAAGNDVILLDALNKVLVDYSDLLDEMVKSMICHVQSFDKYPYIARGDKIMYKEQDDYNENINYRYRTVFAYYHEHAEGKISMENWKKAKKLYLRCGSFSFAEVPKIPNFQYILGVTGTLETLTEDEISILETEFKILRQTYMPSAYGSNNLDYDPNYKKFDAEKEQRSRSKMLNDLKTEQYIILTEPADHFRVIGEQVAKFVGSEENARRAVLVFFETEEKLRLFEQEACLTVYRNDNKLRVIHEGLSAHEKTKLIKEASCRGRVTLLTKVFGRGVDFICKDEEVIRNKGVVVLQTFLSRNVSEEVQIKGRTARQGQEGAYRMILDKDTLQTFLISASDLACRLDAREKMLKRKRDAFFETTYAQNRSDVSRSKAMHVQFLDNVQNMLLRRTEKVQEFLLAENTAEVMLSLGKGGTLILLDATGSMSHCMQSAKTKVKEIFELSFMVLKKYNIPDGSMSLQFGAYRNYDSKKDKILQLSNWENNADNLLTFLKPIQVEGGWGHEAMEVGLEHAAKEAEANRLAQVIVIGDIGANPAAEIISKRSSFGEKYWVDSGFPSSAPAEDYLARLKACGVPVYPFYVSHGARADFERYAALTGGEAKFLDVNSKVGGVLLTDFIAERVLYSIGGEKGQEMVASYREVANQARQASHSK